MFQGHIWRFYPKKCVIATFTWFATKARMPPVKCAPTHGCRGWHFIQPGPHWPPCTNLGLSGKIYMFFSFQNHERIICHINIGFVLSLKSLGLLTPTHPEFRKNTFFWDAFRYVWEVSNVIISFRLADAEILRKPDYFGKFGKIHKVVINHSTQYAGSQLQVSRILIELCMNNVSSESCTGAKC